MADLRFALRVLLRTPGPTFVAVGVLAIGIGATTALAAVAHALLVEPLPFATSGRPVAVVASTPQESNSAFAPGNYLDLVERQNVFTTLAAYRSSPFDLVDAGLEPESVGGAEVTSTFFEVFDTAPLAGRLFQDALDRRAGEARVVLSEGVWRRRFQADPALVGRTTVVNGRAMTVVGVAPAAFDWPAGAAIWTLAADDIPVSPIVVPDLRTRRDVHYMAVVGRLKPGVTIQAAGADVTAIAAALAREHPAANATRQMRLVRLEEQVAGDTRAPLVMLLAAAALVLAIGWTNVAGLQLARGAGRVGEMAVRAALGASRVRIVRQLLVESVVLGAAGGVAGVLLSFSLVRAIRQLGANLPRVAEVAIDPPVLAGALVLTVACSLLFGTAHAWQGSRALAGVTRGGRGVGASSPRLRAALVVAEVALALVLVVGATLLSRSAAALVRQDPGFDAAGTLAVGLALPQERYPTPESRAAFYRDLLERLRARPVLGDTAIAFPLPAQGSTASGSVRIEGRPDEGDGNQPIALFASVSDRYFAAAAIPLRRGRDFTPADGTAAEPVVIISEAMARLHWPDSDPLESRVSLGGDTWFRIVGIAGDIRQEGPAIAPKPMVYIPYEQFTVPFSAIVLRPKDTAAAIGPLVRDLVHEVDAVLPVNPPATLASMQWAQTEASRVRSIVLGAFAGVALVLAAVGLYGLMSFMVHGRTREFGVRVALGASPGHLLGLVTRQGLVLGGVGVACGLAVTWYASRLLERFLFGVTATDGVTYAAAAGALVAITAAATLVPARRAARVDPIVAMRE